MPASSRSSSAAEWSLQNAKNKLSEVVDAAQGGPQVITRRGVKTAVIVAYEEYERAAAARRGPVSTLGSYLLQMPMAPARGDKEEFERLALVPRDVAF